MFAGWAPFLRDREIFYAMYSFGPFLNTGVILCAAWMLAFGFAMLVWGRATKITLLATVIIAAALLVAHQALHEWSVLASTNLGFLMILTIFALLGTPASRLRLAIGAATWLAVFVGLYAANSMLRGDGNRAFWTRIATPQTIALGLFVALIFVVCLVATKRPRSAVVVLWSWPPGLRPDGSGSPWTTSQARWRFCLAHPWWPHSWLQ